MRRTNYVNVNVDVDLDDILSDVDAEILLEELKSRRVNADEVIGDNLRDLAEEALAALKRGDSDEAELILTRALFPIFSSPDEALKRLAKLRQGA